MPGWVPGNGNSVAATRLGYALIPAQLMIMLVSFDAEKGYRQTSLFRNLPSHVDTDPCETDTPGIMRRCDHNPSYSSRTSDHAVSPVAIRILVVEDFPAYRSFICSMFSKTPELQVVCEVSDGLEAVRKAEELQPDLILLDIGLPTLNGIEAARQIRKLDSKSKIIFLSQESSADLVREALSLGAWGYVLKSHSRSDLLPAVETVMLGKQFVSRGLSGHSLAHGRGSTQPPRPQ